MTQPPTRYRDRLEGDQNAEVLKDQIVDLVTARNPEREQRIQEWRRVGFEHRPERGRHLLARMSPRGGLVFGPETGARFIGIDVERPLLDLPPDQPELIEFDAGHHVDVD